MIPAIALFARIPPWAWRGLAIAAALGALWIWHAGKVSAAYDKGAAEQRDADHKAVTAAQEAAAKLQADLKAATATTAAAISKGTDDALNKDRAAIARSYDDLRLQWAAHRADKGRAGQGGSTGVAGAAGVPDAAYCAAQGWVSLDVASAAAEAADAAIAKDDAWREWWLAQEAAWPK